MAGVKIDGEITPMRFCVGASMYVGGMAALWPPTWFEAIVVAVCTAAFVTLYNRIEVTW